ncbi:MAG: glycosyltransferase family 2 protein [Candidatus Melainabacteria bacterium]|nr:glycosyltransferase family 2 protein [Candidatus Melainabacteria bacterium]
MDPGFRDNIVKLLNQNYLKNNKPHFEVIFSIASSSDPCYPILKEISQQSYNVPLKLVIAGDNPIRAQKINNQLHALGHISPNCEVLVFVDSDVIATANFLRFLVNRLDNPTIGATTGYRFYIPYKGDLPSVVRSLWNRMSAWELVHPNFSFAWGGAMAIHRSTFARALVAKSWEKAADDDLSLTTSVKKLGLKIHFVPQCLVASHGDATLSEIWEWTNRQLILTKVYYPQLWQRALVKASFMTIWLSAMMVALVLTIISHKTVYLFASLAGLSLLPIELWFLWKAQLLWQKVLCDRNGELRESFWRFCLAVPAAHVMLPFMTLYSLVTNRIQWRGITYELRGPAETVVVQPGLSLN